MKQKFKKWLFGCFILLGSIITQKSYAVLKSSPLNTNIHLYWYNPDGTSGDCYNQSGGGAPSVCSTTICLGESICFSYGVSFSSGACNYTDYNCNHDILYFSDGQNITVENINYLGSSPTGCVNYTPTSTGLITTTGVNGLSFSIYVISATPPSLSASITPSINVCANSQICAQSLTSPIISYSFSSSSSSGCINSTSCGTPNTTAFCLPAGSNQISYIVNAGHTCSNTAVYNVNVLPTTMSISPNGSCSSLTQTFVANFNCNISQPILSYVWTVNSGSPTYTTNTLVVTFPTAGTYTLDCTAYDINGFAYNTHNIVSIGLMPSVSITTNTNTICNSTIGFTATPSPSGAYTYTWSVKDAATNTVIPTSNYTITAGTTATPLINFANVNQNINVCVSVTNTLGCTANYCLFMPSCCSTPTNVVKYTNTTYSTLTSLTGTAIAMAGTITVNSGGNLIIASKDVKLDPNTKFVLNGTGKISFSGDYVHGCNYMWDGIYAYGTSTVTIANSRIEDANRVFIDSFGAASISITSSYLNKNNIGLVFRAAKTSTASVTIKNTLFTCSNISTLTAVPKIPTAVNLTNAATLGAFTSTVMLPPYSTQKSFCGIYMYEASHTGKTYSEITLGAATNEENVFDKMQMGIYSYDSKSLVQNNVFQNFKSTIAPFAVQNSGIFLIGPIFGAGIGSRMDIGGSLAQKNTFRANDNGIYNFGKSALLATYNTFSVQTTGVYVSTNNNGLGVGVNFNNFYQNGIAVNFYNNTYLTGSIKNNNMNNTASAVGTYADNFAIRCTEATLATNPSSYPAFDIDNNNISGYYNGIYAVNTLSLIAVDNEVHMRADNTTDHWQAGITVIGSNANKINSNIVDMPSATTGYWQSGIWMINNQVPRVQCNSVNNLAVSLQFNNDNSTAATDGVKSNSMQNAGYGIWLANYAKIGNQTGNTGSNSADNAWAPTCSLYVYSQIQSNPSNNIFFTRSLGSGYDLPNAKVNRDAPTSGYMFGNNSSAAGTPTTCLINTSTPSNQKIAGSGLSGIMQGADDIVAEFDNEQVNGLSMANATANTSDNSIDNTASVKAMSRRNLLYNIILQNIDTQQDASLFSFMNSIKSNNTGLLLAVDSLIHQAEKKSSIINNAKQANTVIVPSNLVEQSQQEFNTLYLEYLAQNKKLTPAQLSSMISIAQQCPSYYGISVYQARTVLFDITKQTYRNACENVSPSKSSKRMAQTIDNAEQLTSVNVFPNPANNQLFVNADDYTQVSVKLYNIMGILVADKVVVNNNSIDISNFASGVYTYKVYNNDTELKVGKVIITH